MLYLDGNIKKIYLGGHWHQEAYLGSVLVWRGYEWEAAQCGIVATLVESAHGVQALILPADDKGNASCMMNTSASAQTWQLPELYSNLLHTDWVYSAIQNNRLEVT